VSLDGSGRLAEQRKSKKIGTIFFLGHFWREKGLRRVVLGVSVR
jgi:hypothetical protein